MLQRADGGCSQVRLRVRAKVKVRVRDRVRVGLVWPGRTAAAPRPHQT